MPSVSGSRRHFEPGDSLDAGPAGPRLADPEHFDDPGPEDPAWLDDRAERQLADLILGALIQEFRDRVGAARDLDDLDAACRYFLARGDDEGEAEDVEDASRRPPRAIRECRSCGCTDDDCRGCIERTGRPCHWVEPDLCSACEGREDAPAPATPRAPEPLRPPVEAPVEPARPISAALAQLAFRWGGPPGSAPRGRPARREDPSDVPGWGA